MGGGGLLGGRARRGLAAVQQAHWCGEERHEVLAARKRRVDQGPGRAVTLPVTQRLPRRRRLCAALGPDRSGPGQGGRRRPELRRGPRRRARHGDRPDPVVRRQGHADHPQGQPGHQGLGQREQGRRCHPRDHQLERGRPGRSHHRPARVRGRQQQRVQGHRQHAAVLGGGGGHRDLADHLPEPVLVAAAGDLLRGGTDRRPGGDLPARRPRRPGGQRAERRHPGCAGVRGQHGLRAADRGAVPGGTAPPRPPSPGDGRGAAARGPGHHRQWYRCGAGAADAGRRGAELDQQPGAGAGHRRRGRHGRHAHPAARPAGDLPPGSVLAVQAHLRLARADDPGDVGPGRLEHRAPAPGHLDQHRRGPGRPGPRPDRPEGQRPDQRARLPRAS